MDFKPRRRRTTPAVIIISLIDILIVLLIFLMVTTTFRQHPAVKLALPQSKGQTSGSTDNVMIVTIAQTEPHFYVGTRPVTFDKLQKEMRERARTNPATAVALRADSNASWGLILEVMGAAKAANVRTVDAFTKPAK